MEDCGKRQMLESPRQIACELSELCSCVEGHSMGEVLTPCGQCSLHLRRHVEKAPQKMTSEVS